MLKNTTLLVTCSQFHNLTNARVGVWYHVVGEHEPSYKYWLNVLVIAWLQAFHGMFLPQGTPKSPVGTTPANFHFLVIYTSEFMCNIEVYHFVLMLWIKCDSDRIAAWYKAKIDVSTTDAEGVPGEHHKQILEMGNNKYSKPLMSWNMRQKNPNKYLTFQTNLSTNADTRCQ